MTVSNDTEKTIEEQAWEVLGEVIDPELGLPISDLGLVYELAVQEGSVRVEMTTTSPICPLGDYLAGEARKRLEALPDVGEVEIVLVNDPPWTIDRLNERAMRQLGTFR